MGALGLIVALGALGSSLPAHHWWARVALAGYPLSMAVAATPRWRRLWPAVAVVACGLVPLAVLVIGRARGWHHVAQSEVDVIESGARRLVHHLTPYRDPKTMSPSDARTNYSYFPYLPAMAIPGLPRALLGTHWFTDARLAMVAIDATMVRLAWGRLRPASRRAIWALAASPLVTLVAAAGGHDLLVASSLVAGYAGVAAALGVASSFTVLGWPLAAPALFLQHPKRRVALVCAIVVASATPVLVDLPAAWANIVEFPAGRTPARSPADAPSVGRALQALPGGTVWVVLVLCGIVGALAWSLWRRPPRTVSAAAARAAVAFVALIAAVPASRAGYLVHPAALAALAWGERRVVSAEPNVHAG